MYTWKSRALFRNTLVLLFLLAIIATTFHNVAGQESNSDWSPQQRIEYHYYDSFAPYLVSDQNGTVHAFHYTNLKISDPVYKSAQTAIYYRQWTVRTGWTEPIDILLRPSSAPAFTLQGVTLDDSGVFHLIYSTDGNNPAIYYSSSPAQSADRASSWSDPILIGQNGSPWAALAGDKGGNLFVLYGGDILAPGLFEIHSLDAGETWSDPVLVYQEYRTGHFPLIINLEIDERGRLHAVWSNYSPLINNSIDVYYARLEADHVSWNEPFQLARKDTEDYEADWPSIVSYHDKLIVAYQDGKTATRWMRVSENNGKTWTEPYRPFPQLVGENGAAVFIVDSNDNLHVLMGNRTSGGAKGIEHGMWHSIWLGDQWGPVEAIVSGPQTPDFDPTIPHAVISQGNVLLATWSKDTTAGPRNGAWYTYTILDTAELPIVPLPTPKIDPTPIATITLTYPETDQPSTDETVYVSQSGNSFSEAPQYNPAKPIILSVVFIGVFLFVVIVLHRLLIGVR